MFTFEELLTDKQYDMLAIFHNRLLEAYWKANDLRADSYLA